MAIKPILFNAEMVRAILDGRKSCTRRLVKIQPKDNEYTVVFTRKDVQIKTEKTTAKSPYQVGDILYVRETYVAWYLPHGENTYCYRATEPNGNKRPTSPEYDCDWEVKPWRPSIHMPKEAARIWLKVTEVRVERLQDITPKDAENEGVGNLFYDDIGYSEKNYGTEVDPEYGIAKEQFAWLWESTIKKSDLDRYGWDANPWVWVIEFEPCEKPEGV